MFNFILVPSNMFCEARFHSYFSDCYYRHLNVATYKPISRLRAQSYCTDPCGTYVFSNLDSFLLSVYSFASVRVLFDVPSLLLPRAMTT